MINIEKTIRKFKKEFKIKGIPTVEDLKRVISELSYKLHTYNDDIELTEKMVGTDAKKYPLAITCLCGRERHVFYDERIMKNDLPFVLAHETGHIYLNHLDRCEGYYDNSDHKEIEADKFATLLMCTKKTKIPIYLGVLICLMFISYFLQFCSFEFNIILR